MLTVYTAAIGETDHVRPPADVDPDARYLCFSDRQPPAPYVWVPVERTAEDEGITARRYKVLADHPMLAEGPTLWHDASYRLKAGAVGRFYEALAFADVVALAHPRRTTVEQEGQAVARYGYVTPEQGAALVAEYRAAGFPDVKLSSGGLIARRQTCAAMNRRWWAEIARWGYRDQPSLDFSAWVSDVRVLHLFGTPRTNGYAVWRRSDVEGAA